MMIYELDDVEKEAMLGTVDARRLRSSLRKEAQAINERNRVPGDRYYKEQIRPVEHQEGEKQ